MQKDIIEKEIAEIIKGFRQPSVDIEINQEHKMEILIAVRRRSNFFAP